MSEKTLSAVVQNLLGKIDSPLVRGVSIDWGLATDLKIIHTRLSSINAVLLDAEEKQGQDEVLYNWLRIFRDYCYDAEDALDLLEYQGLRKQVVKQYGSTEMIKVWNCFSSSNPLMVRLKIGHEIKLVSENFDTIGAITSIFALMEIADFSPVVRRVREMTDTAGFMIVGREFDKMKIMEFLLQPSDKRVEAISIIGIQGLGKTTLAMLLYDHSDIDQYFQLKMWVGISEDGFEKRKIVVKMMNSLTKQNLSDYSFEQLQILIRKKLNGNKFLLVLDDVWSVDRVDWVELIALLEEGESGSKIIVTTSSDMVAQTMRTTSYYLSALSVEDSFYLFKKWAFRGEEGELYPNLVEIMKTIVKRSQGIPLAIRTLGTLLYERKDEREWRFIRDNDIWNLEQDRGDISPFLKLSYDQLPSRLKPCFAICSIFPKNMLLSSHFLIEVWMAHGLIQPLNENEVIEDIGLHFVKVLCSRAFFQDIEEIGCTWFFRMHDLVHDFAMSVAHSECMIVNQRSMDISWNIRHLSFSDVNALLNKDIGSLHCLQTIMSPQLKLKSPVAQSLVDKCVSSCKLLRMLDLKGLSFEVLPSSIGGLKHLRYLNLSFNVRIKKLPDSLWTLYNLQSLLLYRCVQLEELPGKLRRLLMMRFLEFTTKQKRLPKNVLSSLKCLFYLVVADCNNLEVLLEGASDLGFLCHLGVSGCGNLTSLASSLKYFAALKTLAIGNCPRLDLTEWDDDQDVVLSLECLVLGKLPQLMTIPQWLQRSTGTLEYLKIYDCEELSSLPEWLGNFTSLNTIEIRNCPKLSQLPERMYHLTALKKLVIKGCSALAERYKMDARMD